MVLSYTAENAQACLPCVSRIHCRVLHITLRHSKLCLYKELVLPFMKPLLHLAERL